MSEIKKLEPLTGWMDLHLATDIIDPPVLRVRLRPLTAIDMMDAYTEAGVVRLSQLTLASALAAIAEWDLTESGRALPCTDEAKAEHAAFLKVLLASRVERRVGPGDGVVEDGEGDRFAATEIQQVARRSENFLKN